MKSEPLVAEVAKHPSSTWGSDALASLLAQLDVRFISMVPGSSYRGLHDSLVNYLGNTSPQMIICLHEEHSVAIAHGYAKVTGKPMAVGIHSNVGLMHATMAIYNAYCDRAPMLLIGATGPIDASKRRPWIDWIHTSADQGALIRDYTKWDDQPGSLSAALEAIVRGHLVTQADPQGPVYVCLDASIQEDPLEGDMDLPRLTDHPVSRPAAPEPAAVSMAMNMIGRAERPLILLGRSERGGEAWRRRVALADHIGACVLTDLKTPATFPTTHHRHPAAPGAGRLSDAGADLIRKSDLVLSLDWIDLAGTLKAALGSAPRPVVITASNDAVLLNGWAKDHFGLIACDLAITAQSDQLVAALLAETPPAGANSRTNWPPDEKPAPASGAGEHSSAQALAMAELASAIREAAADRSFTYTGLPLGWSGEDAIFETPLDYLGRDGGGGIGSGPGIAVGAALALDGSGRIPVAVLGDGDCLMGGPALWTAAHHRIPLLVIVANNRSYFNDEAHQERIARMRLRPVENRVVGQHLRDPDPDLATIARGYGLQAFGPVRTRDELLDVLQTAFDAVAAGGSVLVDVHVDTAGYAGA